MSIPHSTKLYLLLGMLLLPLTLIWAQKDLSLSLDERIESAKLSLENQAYEEATAEINALLHEAVYESSTLHLAEAYYLQGLLCKEKNDPNNALENFLKSNTHYNSLGDETALAYNNLELGKLEFGHEKWGNAKKHFEDALLAFQKNSAKKGETQALINLAEVAYHEKYLGTAIDLYKEAKAASAANLDPKVMVQIYKRLGDIVHEKGIYQEATEYYSQALEIIQQAPQLLPLKPEILNHLAENKMGNMDFRSEYIIANELCLEALAMAKAEDIELKASILFNLAKINAFLGEPKKKEAYYDQCLSLVKNGNGEGHQFLSKIASRLEKEGQVARSLTFLKTAQKKEKELRKEQDELAITERINQAKWSTEYAKQQKKMDLISQKKDYYQLISFFILTALMLTCVIVFLLYRNYQKEKVNSKILKEKNKIIQKQSDEIWEKNQSLELSKSNLIKEIGDRESIQQSSFSKDQFVATISHEMRTPLNGIIASTHLLLSDAITKERKEHLGHILFAGNNLNVLINDLLDFTKIEAGQLKFNSVDFNFPEIVDNLHAQFSENLSGKEPGLLIKRSEGEFPVIKGDSKRVQQILFNTIIFASKFAKAPTQLKIFRKEKKDELLGLHLHIESDCTAFKQHEIEEMISNFSPTSGGFSTKNYASGLGLALSKNITELLGGTYEVQTIQGEGIAFKINIEFPIVKSSSSKPLSEKAIDLKGTNILLIEDNQLNQIVISKTLRNHAIQVTLANNGKEGIDIYEQEDFDLILMDLQMPILDGYRATEQIRKMPEPKSGIPIIAITASAFVDEKEKAKLFGMDDHIGKPFRKEILLQKIAQLIGNKV